MLERIYESLAGELSGENARQMAARIHALDRTCSYDSFGKSARYCLDRMREFGLESPELLSFPADGKQVYGDYRMPRAWNVKDAELRIVEPRGAARRVASYRAQPLSLAMYSPATPKGGVTAELVGVEGGGSDADYEDVDCEGKIVLGSHSAANMVKSASKRGAIGVVTDFMPTFPHARPTPFDLPDAHVWSKVDATQNCFAFVLSPQEGKLLRDQLSREKRVVMHASVDSRSYDGSTHAVTGLIPGRRKNKEILLVAHLFEQIDYRSVPILDEFQLRKGGAGGCSLMFFVEVSGLVCVRQLVVALLAIKCLKLLHLSSPVNFLGHNSFRKR